MDERHRVALEAVLAGMALRPRLLADLLEGRRDGRGIIVEALEALSREIERAEGRVALRERAIDAAKAGDERRLSAFARRIIEATPPSLRHLLHGLAEELKAGRTPEEAVEALRPKLVELAREAAEAFKGAEDVEYLAKSFGARSSSEEEILRAFEGAFLRAAERLARLPEDRRRDVLGYIERRLGRLLKVVGIAALGVALAVLANDPAWLRRSVEAIAVVNVHAVLPVIAFGMALAKRAGADEAAEAARSITAAEIKAEIWRRAENEKWRRFMDVEEADLVVKGPNVGELVLNGAKIGEIVGERIEGDPRVDTKLKIELPGLRVDLRLNEGKLREAVEKLREVAQKGGKNPEELERVKEELKGVTKELSKFGRNLGDIAFGAAAVRYYKEGRSKVVEDAFILASALEKQMRAMLGESAEEIAEGIWREVYRLDEKLPDSALEALREKKWALHTIDEGARIVAGHLPQYREYIERLGKIADLLKAAARELVKEAEKEGKGSIRWMNGRPYIAYEGPAELSARVEHVTRGGKKYAIIEVKYGEKTARVELEVEKYQRSALLHNLAAIMTDDRRDFYKGRVSHNTTSPVQAAERLLMWALFMPGEYVLKVRYVRATEEGLSPEIEIKSHFGRGGLAKIERESHIHRLVLRLARELAGREKLKEGDAGKILAASWLLASAILNASDDKKPSEGLAVLAERMAEATARRIAWEMAAREGKRKADEIMERARRIVEEQGLEEKYKKALERLRPFLEGLDALLGSVSRADKALLVGKLVDYDGTVSDGFLLVGAELVKKTTIELGSVEIHMLDVAEAAAKAFSEKGGWQFWIDEEGKLHIEKLSLGRVKDVPELKVDGEAPLKIPAYKAMAALMAELRRKDLVEYVELRSYKIGGVEVRIMAAKAREELTPITRLEEIWREFKIGEYTHLRLVISSEKYELLCSDGRFAIKGEEAQKLKKALEELGLKDVKMTSDGRLYLRYERLEALLNKGVMAYAVRKAKRGEAMWRLEITYGGVTMVLEMYYNERLNRLEKKSETGKIKATYKDIGAAEGETVELDLGLLAAAGGNCKDCLEKRLAEAFAAASKKGFKLSVTDDRKYLIVYLPSDFRDVVRRFYSE